MASFREKPIEFGGETYTLAPTMRLLDKIEARGLSSERISHEAMNGNVMKGAMSRFMGITLREAGIDISDERLLQEIEHHPQNALRLFMQIRDALYTEPPEEMLSTGSSEKPVKKKTAAKKA